MSTKDSEEMKAASMASSSEKMVVGRDEKTDDCSSLGVLGGLIVAVELEEANVPASRRAEE